MRNDTEHYHSSTLQTFNGEADSCPFCSDELKAANRQTLALSKIASFGYRVYNIKPEARRSFQHKGNFAVADPFDTEDGFYLIVRTIEEAYDEMNDAGLLTRSEYTVHEPSSEVK